LICGIGTLAASPKCAGIRSRVDITTNVKYSEWGRDDEHGALNRLGPHKVRQAIDTITNGKTYQLGYVEDSHTRAFGTRVFKNFVFSLSFGGSNELTGHDDYLFPSYVGVGSQIDTLSHICVNTTCYNRFDKSQMFHATGTAQNVEGTADGTPVALDGLKNLGADNLLPIVTRGIVLDMPAIFGKSRLEVGDEITCEKITAALKRQRTSIKAGDVVLLHTGYSKIRDQPEYVTSYPGLTLTGAQYLIEHKIVAVGADTIAVEAVPSAEDSDIWPGSIFPVHTNLITKNGIYILEVMNTEVLVEAGITEFMFVLGAPRFRGAAQAYVNPVAIK